MMLGIVASTYLLSILKYDTSAVIRLSDYMTSHIANVILYAWGIPCNKFIIVILI